MSHRCSSFSGDWYQLYYPSSSLYGVKWSSFCVFRQGTGSSGGNCHHRLWHSLSQHSHPAFPPLSLTSRSDDTHTRSWQTPQTAVILFIINTTPWYTFKYCSSKHLLTDSLRGWCVLSEEAGRDETEYLIKVHTPLKYTLIALFEYLVLK